MSELSSAFCDSYAAHRAREGRALDDTALRSLPYLAGGPLARQWQVRAKSYEAFIHHVVKPMSVSGSLAILDAGAGNGWLSHRLARLGHAAVALDVRGDAIDGLGAAQSFLREEPRLFDIVESPFEAMPIGEARFDITVFNAALHYARDLAAVLAEATRVTRPGGRIVILDSPFYAHDRDGAAMVAEKRRQGAIRFGARADVLLSQGFIEYLTAARLATAAPYLHWTQIRVRYPLWYELRPLQALLQRARRPSRFDLWTASAP